MCRYVKTVKIPDYILSTFIRLGGTEVTDRTAVPRVMCSIHCSDKDLYVCSLIGSVELFLVGLKYYLKYEVQVTISVAMLFHLLQ